MRAVLFDVDGVLLDSYSGYREAWSRWCALRGVDLELAWAATERATVLARFAARAIAMEGLPARGTGVRSANGHLQPQEEGR